MRVTPAALCLQAKRLARTARRWCCKVFSTSLYASPKVLKRYVPARSPCNQSVHVYIPPTHQRLCGTPPRIAQIFFRYGQCDVSFSTAQGPCSLWATCFDFLMCVVLFFLQESVWMSTLSTPSTHRLPHTQPQCCAWSVAP